jgi:3-phenylpropionate/cinnamic acid dioxygenase small subunit
MSAELNGQSVTPGTDEKPFASLDVHAEVRAFLDREAEMLDSRLFVQWLQIVHEDFAYLVPVPMTPDNPEAKAYDPDAFVIDENRETLAAHWFRRYEPDMWEMAWAENPPVRYRHFITNVRVREAGDDTYDVRSNVIVTATRQSNQPDQLIAERFDTIVRRGESLLLLRRFVVPDSTVLQFIQLRVIL